MSEINLRELLRYARMSQREFARQMGVGPQAVHNWITRKSIPAKYFHKITKVLGCDIQALINPQEETADVEIKTEIPPALDWKRSELKNEIRTLKAVLEAKESFLNDLENIILIWESEHEHIDHSS